MRGTRRTTMEEEVGGAQNEGSSSDTIRMLMEMMETMRRQNDECAEAFRRSQEETRQRMD